MLIKLDGYQLVAAAQDYIKKEYGVDMKVDSQSLEAWVTIEDLQTPRRYDSEKHTSYPAHDGVTLDIVMTPLCLLEEEL